MKVFISYAHNPDAPSHAEKVRLLADRLKRLDLEVAIDRDNPDPDQGWLDWMEERIKEADRVLIVFTELYYSRWYDKDSSPSWGARWEGKLIKNLIGVEREAMAKYLPVLFEEGLAAHIPTILLDRTRYTLRSFSPDDEGFSGLAKHLTGRDLDASGEADRPRSLRFRLGEVPAAEGQSGGYLVQLDWEGQTAEEPFDGDPLNSTTIEEAIKGIDSGRDEKEHLKIVGLQLWEGLMTGKVRDLFRAAWQKGLADGRLFHLRLGLPPKLDALPWEALFNEEESGFLATREQYCIVRTGPDDFPPALPRVPDPRPPGILLVVPSGSGLDLARETQTIQNIADALGGVVRVGRLDDPVTLERLGEEIERGRWDVVHFAGHGRFTKERGAEIRLNGEGGGERWVDADLIAPAFNKGRVRLVVLNCCKGASSSGSRIVAGLGPILVGRRVAAVVAMRYEIADDAALCFAERFYRVLLAGPKPGRVDLAIEAARVAVFQNPAGESQRGFVTPTLYLAPGGETIFDLPKPRAVAPGVVVATAVAAPGAAVEPAFPLPEGLIEAIRDRRCIPVLGVGLVAGGAIRREAAPGPTPNEIPPGLPELMKAIVEAAKYSDGADLDLFERGGEWLQAMILRRVCEQLRGDDANKFRLGKVIDDAFRSCKPPASIASLASWDVPGYICLHIDGLLEQELIDRKKPYRALQIGDPAPAELEITRLVNLAGTWRGRAQRAPALTEQAHDALCDRLAQPPDWLTNLITATGGRSLLFLGAHPRDPLVRRLASRLYAEEIAYDAGPLYFASTDHRPADDAYWANFKVQWIERTPAALIAEIDAALKANREGAGR